MFAIFNVHTKRTTKKGQWCDSEVTNIWRDAIIQWKLEDAYRN